MNITKYADMDLYTQLEIANKRGELTLCDILRAIILDAQSVAKKKAKAKKVVFCDDDY